MRTNTLVVLFTLCCGLGSCATPKAPTDPASQAIPKALGDPASQASKTWINAGFVRSDAEREKLELRAAQGDSGACEELSNHYAFIEQDQKRAIYWLRKAVRLDPRDQILRHNLAVLLDTSPD